MSSVPSVEIACPKCTQRIAIPRAQWQQYVGKVTACPTCSQQILVQDFAVPPPPLATVASEPAKNPERRSPRWTKLAMLIATAIWVVWMPAAYAYFQATAFSGYKKIPGVDQYMNVKTGELSSGGGLRFAASFAAGIMAIRLPTMLYFASVFVLAVLHFALTR